MTTQCSSPFRLDDLVFSVDDVAIGGAVYVGLYGSRASAVAHAQNITGDAAAASTSPRVTRARNMCARVMATSLPRDFDRPLFPPSAAQSVLIPWYPRRVKIYNKVNSH